VNFSKLLDAGGEAYEHAFMANFVKKFLGADLKRYIDAFSDVTDKRGVMIRLPELRLDQALSAGIRLPPSTIPNTRNAFRQLADAPASVTDVVVGPVVQG
jgi:hypothetical protein